MTKHSVLTSVTLVTLVLTFLVVGCSKEEPAPPTAEAQPRPVAPPPPPPPPTPAPPAISQQAFQDFQNQDIFFDYDKYDLRTDARATLDRKATFLNQASTVRSQIEGHCDERGTNEYNLALGERRANAAKQYLTTAGVSAARLTTISYGEERPLDPGRNEAAWARNRRAHFVITGQ
jgi:peptidoglycan-associated lipoprotein